MLKIVILISAFLSCLSFSFQLSQMGINKANEHYQLCRNIPSVVLLVNNNSISTSTPDQKNMFISVTGKNTLIYKFPIDNKNSYEEANNDEPYQTLKQANFSSSTDFTSDGLHLAVGSASSNTQIYTYDGSQYVFKQSLKNSYDSNGGRVLFSNDGQFLFTVGSPKQILVYHQGANLYQLFQNISVNLQSLTIFSLSHDSKHFTIIQMQQKNTFISMFSQQQKENKFLQIAPSKLLNKLVLDMSMSREFIAVVLGTLRSNCSTIIYKISNDFKSFDEFQQIFMTGACALSASLSDKNQLVLSNGYFISTVYQYERNSNGFVKKYEMYHSAQGVPVHTEVRLFDTNLQHLLIYTSVEANIYCHISQSKIQKDQKVGKYQKSYEYQ